MKFRTILRHVREGFRNVTRNGWMAFASISSIAISLFILGVFVLIEFNLDHLSEELENTVEIRVFVDLDVPRSQIPELQNKIGQIPGIAQITFVSKEEGLEGMKLDFGEENKGIIEGYEGDNNPLNDSFTVKVDEPRNVSVVAEKIEALNESATQPMFEKVLYGKGTVEKMFEVTRVIRIVGIVLVIGLAFTAMFLISNTIKLTIMSRRKEIAIMKLVGATNTFIRWPFFIEGALLGTIGSLIPIGLLLYGYDTLVDKTQVELGLMMLQLLPVAEIGRTIFALLLGIGVVLGVWGSTISAHKFLKI